MNAAPKKYSAKSPYCDHILDPEKAVDGWVTCDCGRKSDVRWVSELGWLQTRADWVSERISKSEAWFDSRHQQSAQLQKVHKPASGQQLLYILGGISLVVAVAVFTAVAWERIGAYGQMVALLLVVAIASFVAIKSRENLLGLSNTSAIIATIVAGTGFLSAPHFGLVDESLANADSFYTTFVFKMLVIASFAAGYFTRIPGWTIISIIGLVPTVMFFNEGYLQASQSRTVYMIGSLASLTLTVVAIALMLLFASKRHSINSLFKILVTGSELILVFAMYTRVSDSIQISQYPQLVGLAYLVIAGVWVLIAQRLPKTADGFSANAVSTIASYVASVLIGFSIIIACLPSVKEIVDPWQKIPGSANSTIVFAVSIGSLIMVAPLISRIREMNLGRFFTIAGAVAWYVTTLVSNRIVFENEIENSVTLFALSVISLSLTIRWWKEISKGYFITGIIFGCIAVAYGVNTFIAISFDGPEAVTFSVAAYLLLMAQVLIRRTRDPHNSFIVWGIPFSVALIPSALVANALLFTEYPGKTEWLRFWAVLLVSVLALTFGLKLQKSGLFVPGAIAFAVVSLPQIFLRLSVYVPRWIVFGVIGVLLITVAARFEHLQKLGRDTSRWFKKLS